MTQAVTVENASVSFGGTSAVDNVSLNIVAGECFGIVGESGSGKTTLMRAMLGLQKLQSGTITHFGEELMPSASGFRARSQIIHAMFQDPAASLSPRRRVGALLDEVRETLGLAAVDFKMRRSAMLDRLALPSTSLDKFPHQLSGGQARRVAVARALLLKPRILVSDEPTAGLDVSLQGELLNLLQEYRRETGGTLVIVTHNLAAIRMIADRLVVMHEGRAIETGSTPEIFGSPKQDFTCRLLEAWPRFERHHS